VKYGKLRVQTISLAVKEAKPGNVKVSMNGKAVGGKLDIKDGRAIITLASDVVINTGEVMEMILG